MFNFICGKIISVSNGVLVLQCSHIGYELSISDYTALNCAVGDDVQVYTYLQVKEDGLTLYGFSSEEEKKIFKDLLDDSTLGFSYSSVDAYFCEEYELEDTLHTFGGVDHV